MDFKPLASFIDRITSWRIPWAEVLVMHRNDTVFHYRNGYANLEEKTPIGDGAIFNLYSMTKIMTCVAGLQLVEKGEMLLSDPLSDYLPEYAEMTVKKTMANGEIRLEKATRAITVRDLFTMTAGFSYNVDCPSIQEAVKSTDGTLPTRDFARALAKEPLLFEPGTHWNYSMCHDVLGALVEVVSGKRFGTYLRDEITGPLGMNDTAFNLNDEQQKRLIPQYAYNDELEKAVRMDGNGFRVGTELESGGAGLLSTVSDYARFLNALTGHGTSPEGVRILSQASVELMRTDHLNEMTRADYSWDHMYGYGYGLGVRTHISKAGSGSLSPIGEFGWSGAAGCMAIIDPDSELTVMYAQHLLNSQEPYVQRRLRNVVYSCL
ncbi:MULTISPECIES: serine hydrolase [unclassified Paenibacillus]|uniref:serine hydrolase domain-containing protein n=2 Tax=Paenibacillus TaxID=44249 RepID=UPI000CFCD587|nr:MULTISPECIES: serine hydrolase domain-containing protein [unclassified Paenibacillus]MBD8837343.1 beta-lactamase family protein [Paenibacillus sp. CFBP 13594]PRA07421.1 serine hydrolase [Paenibacillus sp. MYb63]PRA51066.1 serine hydrolase [Paenibacillus sp. MYb67]QZN74195.1 beta-lactamase family protein [Paenibacillus sp. DR312]